MESVVFTILSFLRLADFDHFFCRYFELYIYGTLFIGKEARASMSPSVSHLIFLISIAHTSVLLSEIVPSILAASTSPRMYVSTFLP